MRRLSWPCGGGDLGGLTMSEDGGLEEVEESLRRGELLAELGDDLLEGGEFRLQGIDSRLESSAIGAADRVLGSHGGLFYMPRNRGTTPVNGHDPAVYHHGIESSAHGGDQNRRPIEGYPARLVGRWKAESQGGFGGVLGQARTLCRGSVNSRASHAKPSISHSPIALELVWYRLSRCPSQSRCLSAIFRLRHLRPRSVEMCDVGSKSAFDPHSVVEPVDEGRWPNRRTKRRMMPSRRCGKKKLPSGTNGGFGRRS